LHDGAAFRAGVLHDVEIRQGRGGKPGDRRGDDKQLHAHWAPPLMRALRTAEDALSFRERKPGRGGETASPPPVRHFPLWTCRELRASAHVVRARVCSSASSLVAGLAGSCNTVASWPSHRKVSRTLRPSGSSSVS